VTRLSRKNPRSTIADIGVGAPRARPVVRNRANLARFETALATKACPVITVIGNSITWGVGSDGIGTGPTSGFVEVYRQNAWPVLLRKRLAMMGGYQPCENFVGVSSLFGYATNLQGTAAGNQGTGPFGYLTGGGGMYIPDTTAAFDIAAAKLGSFTDLDVLYWGTGSSVAGGYSPQVFIDDVQVAAGGVASSGNLAVQTVTGFTDTAHKITLKGTGSSNGCFVAGVVPRRSAGIVVNRIAIPGARAVDVSGSLVGFTTVQQTRNLDAAVTAGYSDLVIIQFSANEVYQQTTLSDYQAALNAIISRASATVSFPATACVLLLGDPMNTDAETGYAIKRSDYLGVMKTISDTNPVVAYADMNDVFGDRATGEALGLWPGGTVHPTLEGHRRMADFILDAVLPSGSSIIDTAGVGPARYTSAEETKLAGVATGATANSPDATLEARANHTGTQSADTLTDGTTNKAFLATERTKLTGIATGATANSAEASAATASTLALRDANANILANNHLAGGRVTAQAAGTTTLTTADAFAQYFTGSAGQTVALPSSGVTVGYGHLIVNAGTGNVVVSGFGTLLPGQSLWVFANAATPAWNYGVLSSAVLRATATASSAALRDANSNLVANAVLVNGASTVTAAGTTTLVVGSAKKQVFTGSTTQTVVLPTTSVVAYQDWEIINPSSGALTINSSGANLVKTLAAGARTVVTALQATPTTAAHWFAS
jgi:lysophospholipase L1-like esterase